MLDDVWAPRDMALVTTLTDAELFGDDVDAPAPHSSSSSSSSSRTTGDTTTATPARTAPVALAHDLSPSTDYAIDARVDGALMDEVIHWQPFQTNPHKRTAAWDSIARSFASAHGSATGIRSRADVTQRVAVLTLALFEAPQRLPRELRESVLTFNERNYKAGYAWRLDEAFLATLQQNATTGTTARTPKSSSAATVAHDCNTHLCRLILTHRPFETLEKTRGGVWRSVVAEYNASHTTAPISSPDIAQRRIHNATAEFLSGLAVPLSLRVPLVEVNLLYLSRARKPPSEPGKRLVRSRIRDDELFMRVLLDTKPFTAIRGQTHEAWDAVASAYVAAGGGDRDTGRAAVRHFARLVAKVLAGPASSKPAVRAMMLEYFELLSKSRTYTKSHRSIHDRLRRIALDAVDGGDNQDGDAQAAAIQLAPSRVEAAVGSEETIDIQQPHPFSQTLGAVVVDLRDSNENNEDHGAAAADNSDQADVEIVDHVMQELLDQVQAELSVSEQEHRDVADCQTSLVHSPRNTARYGSTTLDMNRALVANQSVEQETQPQASSVVDRSTVELQPEIVSDTDKTPKSSIIEVEFLAEDETATKAAHGVPVVESAGEERAESLADPMDNQFAGYGAVQVVEATVSSSSSDTSSDTMIEHHETEQTECSPNEEAVSNTLIEATESSEGEVQPCAAVGHRESACQRSSESDPQSGMTQVSPSSTDRSGRTVGIDDRHDAPQSGPSSPPHRAPKRDDECVVDDSSLVDMTSCGTASQITRLSCERGAENIDAVVSTTAVTQQSQPVEITLLDEDLMRLILDARPYLLSAPQDILWDTVTARALRRSKYLSNGEDINVKSIHARVEWLSETFTNEDQADSGRLTPALRMMLREYNKVTNAKLQRLLSSLFELKPGIEGGRIRLMRESLDGVLLGEVLRVRFKPGESKAAWQRVARAVNERIGTMVFMRGKTCKRRVKELLNVYRDPSRSPSLLASERDKLERLERITDNSSERCPRDTCTSLDQIEPQPDAPIGDSVVPGSKPLGDCVSPNVDRRPRTVRPLIDLQFMQLVLRIHPSSHPPGERMQAWNEIAELWASRAVPDTELTFTTGPSAMRRVRFLLAACSNPNHPQHPNVTPALRAVILQYKNGQPRYGRVTASPVVGVRGKSVKRSLSVFDFEPLNPGEEASTPIRSSKMKRTRTEDSPLLGPSVGSTDNIEHVDSERLMREQDEAIVRRLLDLRPFWAHTLRKTCLWDEVFQSIRPSRFRSAEDVMHHVEWLVEVAQDRTHDQHAGLGTRLMNLLQAYTAVSDKNLERLFGRIRRRIQKEKRLSVKNLTVDDIVLEAALGLSSPWSDSMWRTLVSQLNIRFGADLFTSSGACKERVVSLVQEFLENKDVASFTRQQKALLGRLAKKKTGLTPPDIDAPTRVLNKASESMVGSKRTVCSTALRHREALFSADEQDQDARVAKRHRTSESTTEDEILSKDAMAIHKIVLQVALNHQPFPNERSLNVEAWHKVASEANTLLRQEGFSVFRSGSTVRSHIERVLDQLNKDPGSFPASIRKLAARYSSQQPSSSVCLDAPAASPSLHNEDIPTSPLRSKPDSRSHWLGVQQDTPDPSTQTSLQELLVARERKQVGATTPPRHLDNTAVVRTGNQQKLVDERTVTVRLLEQLEHERRDRHEQHQAFVSLFRAEREAQRHQTTALLDAIERERQDRREEFAALAKLLQTRRA